MVEIVVKVLMLAWSESEFVLVSIDSPPPPLQEKLFVSKRMRRERIDSTDLSKMATGYDFQGISGSSKKRTRNQTVKGREFQGQLNEDQRSSAQRGWRKQINNIENCLTD